MDNYRNYEVEDFLQDDSFIDWILNVSDKNSSFWEKYLLEHPEKSQVIKNAAVIIQSIKVKPLATQLSDSDLSSEIKLVQQRAFNINPTQGTAPVKLHKRAWFKIAAVILIIVTAGIAGYQILLQPKLAKPSETANIKLIEVSNKGTKSSLVLMNDGSLAILSPGSQLEYPRQFIGKQREIYLEGKAFFEVHKDHLHPFLVHTQNMITRVLGTSFTVTAFKKDPEFKVVVNTGKVWVYDQNTDPTAEKENAVISLTPNQEVTFKRSILQFKKDTLLTPLPLSKEIAQKEFSFKNAPLTEVIQKLNEAYGIQIEYNKQMLGNLRITASLSDRPLNEKVELICNAINVKYSFDNGHIVIKE